jgi:hypothetical protein
MHAENFDDGVATLLLAPKVLNMMFYFISETFGF